jgi:hypothetical protein
LGASPAAQHDDDQADISFLNDPIFKSGIDITKIPKADRQQAINERVAAASKEFNLSQGFDETKLKFAHRIYEHSRQ